MASMGAIRCGASGRAVDRGGCDPEGARTGGMNVDFLTAHDRWPWSRQIGADTAPGLTYRFAAGTDAEWLVVYDDISKPVSTLVPRARRMLFVTEPPGIKTYPRRFLDQFGTIVSPL